jgi:hypothetical protein
MKNSFISVMGMTALVILVWGTNLQALQDNEQDVVLIPHQEQVLAKGLSSFSGDYCEILSDDGIAKDQYAGFDSGMGIAVYMDPDQCGAGDPYPFRITGVHFYLYEPLSAGYIWPVEIQVNIRDVTGGDKCSGPDSILGWEIFSVPSDSAYPLMMHLSLSDPFCVSGSFFLEIMYLSQAGGNTLPSLVMDASLATGTDTCDNWFLDATGYHPWVDFWGSPSIGDGMIRAIGYANAWECEGPWHWKQDTTQAPSGVPDFDQYQFADSAALCAPAAVANCLWWFDAVPEETTPPELVRILSQYFGTDSDSGTCVDSVQAGLNRYLEDYRFLLETSLLEKPDFYLMEDSLRDGKNIVLLLGFWQLDLDWERVGGHYVTLAGISSESTKVALSDPARDAAESTWQGRVRPTEHPSHPMGDTLHNLPQYVCHDIYWLLVEPHQGGNWRLVEYNQYEEIEAFEGQNFQPQQKQDAVAYDSQKPIYTEIEYAILIYPQMSAMEDQEVTSAPADFALLQNQPNPFNTETVIKFHLEKSCEVNLNIYNVLGQKVVTLINGNRPAGLHAVGWDGKDEVGKSLASGIYFCELKADQERKIRRMVLLK